MLINGLQLLDMPIMSLQTGKELARTSSAIINPHNLSIIAYRITGSHIDHDPSYIRIADVREIGSLGMIIDSSEEFIEPDDIISDKELYDLEYDLNGKKVIDEKRRKMGKVTGYIVDADSFIIQQLVVKRPLLKSFTNDELLVHRAQIVEINDTTVIIASGDIKSKLRGVNNNRHYVNPFRQTKPQTDAIKSK